MNYTTIAARCAAQKQSSMFDEAPPLALTEYPAVDYEQRAHDAMLATASVRRLFALRNCPRDGTQARYCCWQWLADLRSLRASEPTS